MELRRFPSSVPAKYPKRPENPYPNDSSEGQALGASYAFSCIKFATTVTEAGGQELLAVSASMQLYHFANVPIKAIEVGISYCCRCRCV